MDEAAEERKTLKFKALIDEAAEKLFKFTRFDQPAEINAFCDDLESQVTLSFESAVQHLGELHVAMVREIGDYRRSLLEPSGKRPTAASKYSQANLLETRQALLALEARLGELRDRPDLDELESFDRELDALGRALRTRCFRGKFMRFVENRLFKLVNDHVGRFVFSEKEEEEADVGVVEPTEAPSKLDLKFELNHREARVNALEFVPNGTILTASSDAKLRVWLAESGELIAQIPCSQVVFSLAVLSNLNVVTGHDKGLVCVWNLVANKLVYRLNGHAERVHSMRVFGDSLATCSEEGTLIVWNAGLKRRAHFLFRARRLGATRSPLGLLSNNYIVTCNRAGLLKVFNPADGRLVRQMDTEMAEVGGLAVLPNDTVALAGGHAVLKVFCVVEKRLLAAMADDGLCEPTAASSLHLLPSGLLLSDQPRRPFEQWRLEGPRRFGRSGFCFCLHVWDPRDGVLVGSVALKSPKSILALGLAKGFTRLATVDRNERCLIWSLS